MKKYTFHPELRRAIGKYRTVWPNQGASEVIHQYANAMFPWGGWRMHSELIRFGAEFTYYAPSGAKVIPFRGTLVPVKYFRQE